MTGPEDQWYDPDLGPCACAQLRKASRALSAFYDQFLAPAGLTVSQYSVLVKLGRAGSISRTQLAGQLALDRTTLTRNLRPLEREGLVVEKPGEDRREHSVMLSKAGRKRVDKGFECWKQAQAALVNTIGKRRFAEMRGILSALDARS